jgi:serine/threonine-protein kinase
VPPSLLNPLLSPAFDRIVARALAKQPEGRYATAQAFRDDMQRALNGENLADTLPGSARRSPELSWPQAELVHASDPGVDDDATRIAPGPHP